MKLKNLQHDFSLIQVYAPTSSVSDADKANFYDDVEVTLKKCKHNEIPIIMGDFNAKVGNNTLGKTIGNNGLGTKNERVITLVEWCHEQNSALLTPGSRNQSKSFGLGKALMIKLEIKLITPKIQEYHHRCLCYKYCRL